jgi:GH15 family glucan-1,4-alpha-glucosidase
MREEILARAWNQGLGTLTATYGGDDLDAALLQLAVLRLLPPDDRRVNATIDAVQRELGSDGWLFRYRTDDGLGKPTVAFTLCTFWLVEALASVGRLAEAKEVFAHALTALSPLGLLSEDFATDRAGANRGAGVQWGNFPQAYSHVGLIHAAFAVSARWTEIL